MKTLIVALLFPVSIFAQDMKIFICKDAMTDKEYAYFEKGLLCSDDGLKGFHIMITLQNKYGDVSYQGLIVNSSGVGRCFENDELYILFEDDTKVSYKSWNSFNCEGKSYFDLKGEYLDQISSKKIKAIRLKNGRSGDTYTYILKPVEQSYFIKGKSALESKQYINSDCDK